MTALNSMVKFEKENCVTVAVLFKSEYQILLDTFRR
jgi:hypothetical protein